MGRFITVTLKFSPEAKHFLTWLNTHLAIAAAAAPFLWDNLALVQAYIPHSWVKWIQVGIIAGMVFNSTRKK